MLNIRGFFHIPIQFSAIFRFEAHFLWAQFKKFTVIIFLCVLYMVCRHRLNATEQSVKLLYTALIVYPSLSYPFWLKFACRLHDYENK